jgi:hypothetical protein
MGNLPTILEQDLHKGLVGCSDVLLLRSINGGMARNCAVVPDSDAPTLVSTDLGEKACPMPLEIFSILLDFLPLDRIFFHPLVVNSLGLGIFVGLVGEIGFRRFVGLVGIGQIFVQNDFQEVVWIGHGLSFVKVIALNVGQFQACLPVILLVIDPAGDGALISLLEGQNIFFDCCRIAL